MSRHTGATAVEKIHRIFVTRTVFNILPVPTGEILLGN